MNTNLDGARKAAEDERNAARTSLEAMERRVGELEAGVRAAITELGDRKYAPTYVINALHRLRALTPDAGEVK